MRRTVIITLVIILLPLVILISARNIIAKNTVSAGVKAMTGLDLTVKSINIGIFKSIIGIEGLKLYNPPGFADRLMVNIPEIYVDYDLGAFLRKKVYFKEIRLNLQKLVVVKNKKGELNLSALKVAEAEGKTKPVTKERNKDAPEFKIDILRLKVGKVIFKDYSQGRLETKEFNINIDERYENITNPYELSKVVIAKALTNTTIGSLANIDLGSIKKKAANALNKAAEEINKTLNSGANAGKTAQDIINKKKDEFINTINKALQSGQ